MNWRVDHPNGLTDQSELLIDGFPSSANSYTRSWIHFANPDATIASHQHSGAIIEAAIRREVPTVVVYRDPVETITSMLARFPRYRLRPPHGPKALLRWYVRFYEPVLASLDRVVLASFETATDDLTGTVSTINDRFGTDFAALDPEYWPAVLAYLREKDADQADNAMRVSAPSEARAEEKARQRAALEHPSLERDRNNALETYRALEDAARNDLIQPRRGR